MDQKEAIAVLSLVITVALFAGIFYLMMERGVNESKVRELEIKNNVSLQALTKCLTEDKGGFYTNATMSIGYEIASDNASQLYGDMTNFTINPQIKNIVTTPSGFVKSIYFAECQDKYQDLNKQFLNCSIELNQTKAELEIRERGSHGCDPSRTIIEKKTVTIIKEVPVKPKCKPEPIKKCGKIIGWTKC